MPKPLPPEPAADDGPTAAEAASHARAMRGAARLATEADAGLTELVEAVHARIAGLQGTPVEAGAGAVHGLAYKTLRGITRPVGNSVATLLSVLAALLQPGPAGAATGLPSREREAIVAALNGLLGDRLARTADPLAIGLAFRHGGQRLTVERAALAAALPQAGGRLLLLIHDLCLDDLQWRRPNGHDHGEALAAALGFAPVHLHYNSGLRVSTNGRALAGQLERLLEQWPHPLARFAIVAHGMGGLLARSALQHGLAAGHHWPHRLDDLACLGTPHHGTLPERVGPGVQRLLGAAPHAGALARLAGLPSAGRVDLRHGNLVDEDWVNGERAEGATDRRKAVPLPAGTRCYAIAGSTTAQDDGLVAVASALGKHRLARRTLKFLPGHQRILDETDHLQLLSSPAVAEQLRDWLRH
jgi:hypothetical protein